MIDLEGIVTINVSPRHKAKSLKMEYPLLILLLEDFHSNKQSKATLLNFLNLNEIAEHSLIKILSTLLSSLYNGLKLRHLDIYLGRL